MPDYILGQAIAGLYTEHAARYQRGITQASEARRMLNGLIKPPLNASVLPNDSDREMLRAAVPQMTTLPLYLLNKLIQKTPRIKRNPVGIGIRAQQAGTMIEVIDNAVADLLFPHDVVLDNLLNEGMVFVVTQPALTHWEKTPDSMYEDEAKTKVKARYAVDSKGRGASDGYYNEPGNRRTFKAHDGESSKYFTSIVKDYRARNLPIIMRVFSRLDAVPINPRRVGTRMVLDALVIKQKFRRSERLKAGYSWGEDHALEPTDQTSGDVEMHTLYAEGPDGPYVSYCIDNKATFLDGKPAMHDLGKDYGIETLPVAFDYGWNFPGESDPGMRGIPFVNVFGRAWMNKATLMTNLLVRVYQESNLFRVIKPDALLMKELGISELMPPVDLKPGQITYVMGDMQDPHSTNSLRELSELLGALSADMMSEMPSKDAFGGGSNVAGYARNVAEDDALGTIAQVSQGHMRVFEQSMAHFNEQAAAIGKRRQPVCLYVNSDIPVEQRQGQQSSTRQIIEIDPECFGDVWDVTAELPTSPGDNMALAQQMMEAHQKGEIPHEWVLEKGWGDTAPEVTIAKVEAEQARKTPLGQADLIQYAAKLAGDETTAKIMQGIAAQQLLQLYPQQQPSMQNTVPQGVTAGVPPPGQPPAMTGVASPNIAASQLGGIVAGGMQSGAQANNAGAGNNGSPY